MKYINQKDYPHWLYVTRIDLDEADRERGKTTTVASSGCGLCSAIMVADRLIPNCTFDLNDAISLSYEVGANRWIGTTYALFAPAFAQKVGLEMEAVKDVRALRRCLRTGGAAVVLVDGDREGQVGLFTHGGHYMAIIAEEEDGRFVILDPAFTPDKFDTEGRRGRVEIKNDIFVLCDEATLLEETKSRSTPFYLFRRK